MSNDTIANTSSASLDTVSTTPAPTALPTGTFNLPDGAEVHKSQGVIQVQVQGAYALGLRSITISGGYSGGTSYFPAGTQHANTGMGFYVGYFPVGSYVFKAYIVGADGKYTQEKITIKVVE